MNEGYNIPVFHDGETIKL